MRTCHALPGGTHHDGGMSVATGTAWPFTRSSWASGCGKHWSHPQVGTRTRLQCMATLQRSSRARHSNRVAPSHGILNTTTTRVVARMHTGLEQRIGAAHFRTPPRCWCVLVSSSDWRAAASAQASETVREFVLEATPYTGHHSRAEHSKIRTPRAFRNGGREVLPWRPRAIIERALRTCARESGQRCVFCATRSSASTRLASALAARTLRENVCGAAP